MKPYIGMMVLYRCRPGQVRAGQQDLAALVTKVRQDGSVDLRIYTPDMVDVLNQQAIREMSQDLQWHCWHVADGSPDALRARIEQLEADLVEAHNRIDGLEGGKAKQQVKKPALV
jgi:hypothetical protein